MLSYVDDFTLTASWDLSHCNFQMLQEQYAILKTRGSRLGVRFSVPKTELIHWCTNRDRDPPSAAPIHLDGTVFYPKSELRLNGLWFTPSLSTAPHFTKRLAKVQAAFVAAKRLSLQGMGLPPFLWYRLAASQLFPILAYGGDVFHPPGHLVRRLAVFWHKVQRWCMNCFAFTPTYILVMTLPLPPGLAPGLQDTFGQPLNTVLLNRDQPCHSPACPLGIGPIPPPPWSAPQGPSSKKRWEPPPPPMALASPPFQQQGPPPPGRLTPLHAFLTRPRRARPPPSRLSAPSC